MKTSPDYKALPSKVSNGVLRLLDRNWKSFFSAMKEWNLNPDKFNGRPNLPRYKDKVKGRNILVYELGAISKPSLRNGIVKLSRTSFFIPTEKTNIKEVRIVPKTAQYIIEIVYDYGETPLSNSQPGIASVDLGLNNLATIGSNIKGFKPLIINGKPLKSINQYYNKYRAELQSQLQKKEPNRYTSNRIDKLTAKRNNKIETYLHQASRTVINYLLQNHIGTLVIGNNQEWKQSINIGKRNNQNFVTIPHYKFISQLIYKAELAGIKVIVREEAYTSKSSFLDLDPIPNYEKGKNYSFSGKRIKRGLYRSKDGILINSDLNGSLNILRKEFPNAFAEGIEGVAASPFRFTPGKVAL
ncbi:MAG: IS607 family transposase ISCbo10 [Chroococcopsis gigantea SAG 12.99]|jgi:putative transposase|nr:IS607 family transposase ISCbo10 [Chroococcopsis gigantea SAG 12.99]